MLSDGSRASMGPLTREEVESRASAGGLEGGIYRRLAEIGEADREEILARYPNIQRRVSGYNLDELTGDDGFDSARFVVGSEGTLVTITQAKLKVVPLPRFKGLAVLHFRERQRVDGGDGRGSGAGARGRRARRRDDSEAGPEQPRLLPHDGLRGRRSRARCWLVEFYGDSEAEVESRLDGLEKRMAAGGHGYTPCAG